MTSLFEVPVVILRRRQGIDSQFRFRMLQVQQISYLSALAVDRIEALSVPCHIQTALICVMREKLTSNLAVQKVPPLKYCWNARTCESYIACRPANVLPSCACRENSPTNMLKPSTLRFAVSWQMRPGIVSAYTPGTAKK